MPRMNSSTGRMRITTRQFLPSNRYWATSRVSVLPGHRDAIRYFEALAAAAPERMQITEYATSWQGRELIYAVLSSTNNIANLEAIKAGMQRLADPAATGEGEAESLIAEQPAVTWLSYGVHGNEISSTDAAMLTGLSSVGIEG